MNARYGSGRHRQPWTRVICPYCGLTAAARRTLPGKPLYLRTHLDDDGELCPPLRLGETRVIYDALNDPNQLELELGA